MVKGINIALRKKKCYYECVLKFGRIVGGEMKRILLVVTILMLILSCGKEGAKQNTDEGKAQGKAEYKIGITQIVAHPALDSAREGFKKAFEEAGIKAEFDEKNANGEVATANLIANNFVNSKVNMIYAIATSTAQAASQSTSELPVVFSAITDPESAGLIKENVTGISDRVDIKQQLQLLLKLDSKIKKVGVIYNSSEQNSKVQVEDLKKAAQELGVSIVEKSITQVSEIPQATEALIRESDAIYLPTDNLVASVVNLITEKAVSSKKIVFGAESAHVKGGALITQGIDYYEMGKEAGKVAIEILKEGKKPSEIKYKKMDLNDIVINSKTLKALGIALPEDVKSKAELVE